MKGSFIPEITTEMLRNGCLESIEALMAEGKIYDIEYSRWIPCSEQVPTASGEYLITWTCEWNGKLKRLISIVEYDAEMEAWHSDVYNLRNYSRKVGIIAWMPMPEAYREAEE